MSKTRPIWVIYLVLIHLLLIVVLIKTDFVQRCAEYFGNPISESKPFFTTMSNAHQRLAKQVPENSVLFFGDSNTQSLYVSDLSPSSVNFGISADTTSEFLKRLPLYEDACKNARCIVLALGINDFPYRTNAEIVANIRLILQQFAGKNVLLSSILPVDESADPRKLANRSTRIAELNQQLKRMLPVDFPLVSFVDSTENLDLNSDSALDREFHSGDGLHLSAAGARVWAADLKKQIDARSTAEGG